MHTIIIESSCECVIGILNHERETTQKVLIFIKCQYDYQKNGVICYADMLNEVQNVLISHQFLYLEEAIDKIIDHLKKRYVYHHLWIRLDKPHILNHAIVGVEKDDFYVLQAGSASM